MTNTDEINYCVIHGKAYCCYIENIEKYLRTSRYDIRVNFREGAKIHTKWRRLNSMSDTAALLDDSREVVKYLNGTGDGRFYADNKVDTDIYRAAHIIVWDKKTEDVEAEAVLGFIGDADYLFPPIFIENE